jgi:hypothetical protein
MRTYGRSGSIAPPFLTSALDAGERSPSRACRSTPEEKDPPVPILWEAGWDPEPVVYVMEEKDLLTLPVIEPWHLSRPARSLIAILTELSRPDHIIHPLLFRAKKREYKFAYFKINQSVYIMGSLTIYRFTLCTYECA